MQNRTFKSRHWAGQEKRPRRALLILLVIAVLLAACGQSATPTGGTAGDAVATTYLPSVQGGAQIGHPRLWLTAADLPRLQSWATSANPLYRDGLALLAERAKQEMDEGRVPDRDCGNVSYEEYPTEMYAELFAFLSLIEQDAAVRLDYASRARTLLMHIMNEAVKGPATRENFTCDGSRQYPRFRHPDFATEDRDRIRYHGEAFPLVVDWIYPSLSSQDKATIRQVFQRWSQEVVERGYHHPEPVGIVNDPILLADSQQVRFSSNNYYAAHMRNVGMMALALDAADDADGALAAYLGHALDARFYIFAHLIEGDSRGGLLPEGLEYSPQTLGYVTQFLLALHTAGVDHPAATSLNQHPFWNDSLAAYLHSLSPAVVPSDEGGTQYQPAFYGDGQRYHLPDFISAFAPIGLYDAAAGNDDRLQIVRWILTHTAPGGVELLAERVRNPNDFREAILYFMLFDPAAAPAADPRPQLAPVHLAPGLNRVFSRSSWDASAAWFTYSLSWNSIDHQMADGNSFAFYRQGEWLTKGRVGYANIAEGIASSEFYNTVAVQNDRPVDRDDDDWRIDLWRRGSQWNYVNDGDPTLLAISLQPEVTYVHGDATPLYNATSEGAAAVTTAQRAVVWLQPDHIVVYDQIATHSAGKFKRWWLQLPRPATITGNQALMQTATGQRLFITTLLPADATLTAVNTNEPLIEQTAAADDPMQVRLRVDGGDAQEVAFLHVLQGAAAGAAADPLLLIQSGSMVRGVAIGPRAVLFVRPTANEPIVYTLPAAVTQQWVTGLTGQQSYTVQRLVNGDLAAMTIQPGAGPAADAGGVLVITP